MSQLHRLHSPTSSTPAAARASTVSTRAPSPKKARAYEASPPPVSWSQALISYIDDWGKRSGFKEVFWPYNKHTHPERFPCVYDNELLPRLRALHAVEDFFRSPDCHLLHIKGDKATARFKKEYLFDLMRAANNTGPTSLAILKRLNAGGRTYDSLPALALAVNKVYHDDVENLQAIQRYIADTRLLLPPLIMRASVCTPLAELATSISLTRVLAVIDEFSEQGRYFRSDEALTEAVKQALVNATQDPSPNVLTLVGILNEKRLDYLSDAALIAAVSQMAKRPAVSHTDAARD